MSTEAETTSAAGTVATPAKVATPVKESPVKEGGSAPSTPSKETDEARIQLTQGRRHLLVKDYFSAVAALAKGCELLAQKFGDTAPELGDAYLTYGRALLELARSESGVLGMNEEGETPEDDEDDGEGEEGEDEEGEGEEKENGEAADAEENGAEAKENGKDTEAKANGAEAKENGNGTEAKENGAEAENGADAEATNGKETNGAADPDQTLKEEEEEDDVNNLQLSWEILELAKGIFQKQIEDEKESKQTCLKLAEVHLKLGEVGVESENYTTAVEDMKACLEIQRKYLDEDDRRIAETLYNMGMAYSLANEFDAAIEQFKSASVQIERRIENLEKKKGDPVPEEKSATEDAFYTVQGEIDELKALLPEIKDKVSDMQDFKKETVRRMMEGLAEASAKQSSTADGAGPSSASASDKPVSSVAHLVKRKPKEEVKEEADKTEKMDTSPAKASEEKTEKVESSSVESTELKAEKVEAVAAESTEEKKADDEVSDRKRKPEDSVEIEDPSKKAKVEESAESKPSE
ncbi:nuclear autoantigenic sperm protein-like [Thrips palmi]|uniref:Nuclear autoantigenic sperm protein-like n=1 Tax=Thrips palmi TaxID=161013 RepID=A0A6P8ZS67_THRPL|nr:nuclear autoantigenic sperm protein-like [Thrips palmi]XP_034248068.1 nuclear autoantigenic sperm protein-like [Thrips palmi]